MAAKTRPKPKIHRHREQRESVGSLALNFVVVLLGIFTLLAVPFRTYSQPLIVMSAIPFGFAGSWSTGAAAGRRLRGSSSR